MKAYNRRSPTANIELFTNKKVQNVTVKICQQLLNFTLSVTHFQISVTTFFKLNHDDSYRELFKMENLEACKIFEGSETTSFVKRSLEWIMSLVKDLSLFCTSSGQMKFNNITFTDAPFLNVFPAGFFSFFARFSNEFDDGAFKVKAAAVVTR
jgi:hypothetical protein